MRILVGLLLLANLAFFCWARWIAPGSEPAPDPLKPAVPRLLLARELPPTAPAASAPAGAAVVPLQCVTIGPFPAAEQARQAAIAFQGDGYATAQREEAAETPDGFWVYIGPVGSEAEQQRIVRRLQDRGVPDAHEIHRPAEGLQVSAGIFSERARAERRAAEVKRLGFKPEIAEHLRAAPTYWLDLTLGAGHDGLKPEDVEALNKGGGGKLGVKPCAAPAGTAAPSAAPAPTNAPASAPAPVAAERRADPGSKIPALQPELA